MTVKIPKKRMQLPREVLVGTGVLPDAPDLLRSVGIPEGTAAVLTGPTTKKVAGRDVEEHLQEAGYETDLMIVRGSTEEDVKKALEELRDARADVAIAVGGGKVIDVTKVASHRLRIPFISVPTSASHDGIASPFASIRREDRPYSEPAQAPLAILADIDVIREAPDRLIRAGVGDVVSNVTAVKDWRLAHRLRNEPYSEYASSLSLMAAKIVMRNAKPIGQLLPEGIKKLVQALISGGVAMSIAGSSRPCSGSEHLFSHALDVVADRPALHGEQCGVGTIIMEYLHGGDWRRIRDTLRRAGAPTTAEELGVSEDELIEALCTAHEIRPERYTILGDRGLTPEAAERAARETGVI